jgi:hypothetical protein
MSTYLLIPCAPLPSYFAHLISPALAPHRSHRRVLIRLILRARARPAPISYLGKRAAAASSSVSASVDSAAAAQLRPPPPPSRPVRRGSNVGDAPRLRLLCLSRRRLRRRASASTAARGQRGASCGDRRRGGRLQPARAARGQQRGDWRRGGRLRPA